MERGAKGPTNTTPTTTRRNSEKLDEEASARNN